MAECRICLAIDTDAGRPEHVQTQANGVTERLYLCPDCREELERIGVEVVDLMQGYPANEVETGERIGESPTTGQRYRLTKWVDQGDGQLVALEKEPIEAGEGDTDA